MLALLMWTDRSPEDTFSLLSVRQIEVAAAANVSVQLWMLGEGNKKGVVLLAVFSECSSSDKYVYMKF